MIVLSIQPSPKRQGPAIQHLNFIKRSQQLDAVEHYVVLQEGHPMGKEFEQACKGVLWIKKSREGIIPRTLNPFKWLAYISHVKKIILSISGYAEKINANVIWTVNEAFPAGPLAARRSGIASCTQVFGMTAFGTKYIGNILAYFHRRYTDIVIPCQDLIQRELISLKFPAERLNVVYNAVDVDAILAVEQKPRLTRTNLRIGMVAGMDRRKGHLLFVKAAALLCKKYDNLEFFIIGNTSYDDEYLAEIHATIADRGIEGKITLTGRVDSIPEHLGKLDIYCTPSKIEALSVAAIEAMSLGLPLVATNVGGNYLTVEEGRNGYLTVPEDSKSMAEAIAKLIDDSSLRATFGLNSKRIVQEKFTLDKSAKKLNSIFRDAISMHTLKSGKRNYP